MAALATSGDRSSPQLPRVGSQAGARSLEPAGRTQVPSISVVIPTFNEAPNLHWVLPRLPDVVSEVILVDGQSSDGTAEVAQVLRPDARILTHPRRGKGNALAVGFAACRGDIIVMLDGDGSADPLEIPKFVAALMEGADYAKGTRFEAGGASDDITWFRQLGNGSLVALVNLLYGTRYTDLCYGLNAFWRRCLPVVAPECDGFEVEAFMNLRATRAGLAVREVGSHELERRAGLSKLHSVRDGSRILRTIIQERLRRVSGRVVVGEVVGVVTPPGPVPHAVSAGLPPIGTVAAPGVPALRVALVNNMPDSAFAATDRQFARLIATARGGRDVVVDRYFLPSLERQPAARAALAEAGYRPVSSLLRRSADALVVTGSEPATSELTEESYWPELKSVLEWGLSNTRSLVLSCLSAHAAALLLDGVARRALDRKCLGVYESRVLTGSSLLKGLPATVHVPHSHWNEVSGDAMRDHGYQLLLTDDDHWTAVSKRVGECLMVLYQGHPEYAPLTLLREYRRDWRRFHLGASARPPQAPVGYLDEAGTAELVHLQSLARMGPDPSLVDAIPFDRLAGHVGASWQDVSDQIYSNWVSMLADSMQLESASPQPLQAAWVSA